MHFTLKKAGAIVMLLLILLLMAEGTWTLRLYHTWPFITLVILLTILLLKSVVNPTILWLKSDSPCPFWGKGSGGKGSALSHLGLALVLLGGMLGAVVETDCRMVVDSHASERVAYTTKDEPVVLPFSLKLTDFRIDYYPDSVSHKQYTSTLELSDSKSSNKSSNRPIICSVNHPARYHGWWIYQTDYDRTNGDFVILQLVRDPWLPMVYAGFLLMLVGALAQVVRAWNSWRVLPVVLLLAVVFTIISLARIELKTMVPALRSIWFFPHILVYMVAYSMMAVTLMYAFWSVCCSSNRHTLLIHRLATTTTALLLVGMLCGAVWAKDAWGQYWTWDPKECWAAATWLIMVVGLHLIPNPSNTPQSPSPDRKSLIALIALLALLIVLILAFAAMQVTWYGVNYLPSAANSMHTYTQK